MFQPIRYAHDRRSPAFAGLAVRDEALGPWNLVAVPSEAGSSAGAYGLLDPSVTEAAELPRDGLLSSSSPAYAIPIAGGAAAPSVLDADGGDSPEVVIPDAETESADSRDIWDHLESFFRALRGLGPVRDDLIEDERGNIHAPEVRELIHDIGAATKANELALRRRIIEMFRGEPQTANWFHQYLSDILRGDPPDEIMEELFYRGDERFRDQRTSIAQFSGLVGVPAAAAQPGTRPFTHLNDPVPPDLNMEEFRRLMQQYDISQEARAWERAMTNGSGLKTLSGRHWNLQGSEHEDVARGYDTAYGHIVGPPMTFERFGQTRTYDYTLLNRLNEVIHLMEAKSGMGRIPSRQRAFDRNMSPPVVYRKEADVLSDGLKMLRHYDRLFMLRNPPQNLDPRTTWTWW